MRLSTPFVVTSLLGWLLYSSLLVLILGQEANPFHLISVWGLAAEHSELGAEHMGYALAIAIAASPLVIAMAFLSARVPASAVIAAALMSALPYLAGPIDHCLAVDGEPLCRYSWQVVALEIALLPLVFGASLHWLLGKSRSAA